MTKETKNNGHPEGGIHELLAYFPKLGVYRSSSDMNELVAIRLGSSEIIKGDERIWE